MTRSRLSQPSIIPLAFAALLPITAHAQGAFLKTTQTFADDARGFCLDLPGPPPNVTLDRPVQSHSCKYGVDASDQVFEWLDGGRLRSPSFDACLAAERIAPGSDLYARDCAGTPEQTPEQTWVRGTHGEISPASRPDLCVTLGNEYRLAGTPAWITPVFHARSASLEACSAAAQARQQFGWGAADAREPGDADTLGRQMPAHLAAAIREIVSRGAGSEETAALYRDEPRVYEPGEIEVVENIAYGPHARHRLDVHTATVRRSGTPMPVVVYVHGGGFVGGNRQSSRNVSDYFASLGLVGVNATYRLAPEAKWPSGSRDVAAAVRWVADNIRDYGGDPSQIYVIGKSAGAFHVAELALRPEIAGAVGLPIAGIVLISGTYTADASDPSDNRIAYFGEDLARWPEISILGNIERSDLPLLVTVSDYDGASTKASFAELIQALTVEHGRMPRALQLAGHDHYSPNPSIGTADTQLSEEIVYLIRSTAGRYQPVSAN
jgi:triacylglycerol lipase